MLEYDKKYFITTEDGTSHAAYYRKGENYDWWQEDIAYREIKDVVSHREPNIHYLNDKQIVLINWMFNYCRVEMLKRNDEYTYSDIEKLTNYIEERFPTEKEEILGL